MTDAARRPRVLILVENLSVPFDRRVWQESRALVEALRTRCDDFRLNISRRSTMPRYLAFASCRRIAAVRFTSLIR